MFFKGLSCENWFCEIPFWLNQQKKTPNHNGLSVSKKMTKIKKLVFNKP
jgi:hypothetical protein